MRHLVTVILVMAMLGAVVSGCGGARHYDSRLTAADSLMRSAPDSALALVEAVDCDSLADEGDRAYRDLLLTQARYRCYITTTSDSDINRALTWYRAHPSEHEKLTRAYIYKGAVMEELHHPDSAMIYYKTAEATAAADDYFNLGYSNMRIAQLYQSYYVNDSAVVARMKKASSFFDTVKDSSYLITTIGTQGAYQNIIGFDSACICLEKAIRLSKEINSTKGLQYQSKLAGTYFYNGDYQRSKELAMEIVNNDNRDRCNEKAFYYYAAKSFLHLNLIDSARWILSILPAPDSSIDSISYYQTLAELSQATRHFEDYILYSKAAHKIDSRLYEYSNVSKLTETELKWNADQLQYELTDDAFYKIAYVIGFSILALILVIVIAKRINKRLVLHNQNKLDEIKRELEKSIGHISKINQELEYERVLYRQQINEKGYELSQSLKRCHELEDEKENISSRISSIILSRQAALNELNQSIRIKSAQDGKKSHLPLVSAFKMLSANGVILQTPLKQSFWDNLKVFVDGEYRGIATFVEENYSDMIEKDMHLFLLVCADLPNSIIKLCMGYTSDVTVSKNKKKLMKENIGLDVKIEEFIHLYMQGKLRKY